MRVSDIRWNDRAAYLVALRDITESRRILTQVRELSLRDDLTRLYNHRGLRKVLAAEIERHQRYGHPLTLIMLDIDNFKQINDTYGHPAGDEVLRSIARKLERSKRAPDYAARPAQEKAAPDANAENCVARLGGDEFVIILSNTNAEQGMVAALRLARRIAEEPVQVHAHDGRARHVAVTVSMGIAESPTDANGLEALLAAADQALYQAKHQGRNRAVRFQAGQAKGEHQNGH